MIGEMGIQKGEEMDYSVGAIVWVRRRNGSWWPGRVLGQDELSTAHLMSPRSGTPVKLLGREDASIDWYNLEKSKRVKSFRCGEFDDCIRKAESCQGMPPKKREKYARREDAILHALDIEKQQIELKEQKFASASSYMNNRKFATLKKKSMRYFPSKSNLNEEKSRCTPRYVNKKTLPSMNLSLDDEYVSKIKHSNQIQGDDDNAEGICQMRGLQDSRLKTASSKRKGFFSSACEGNMRTLLSEDLIGALSPSGRGTAHLLGSKRSPFAIKRKVSHGGFSEESLVKRRDRQHALVQVLQSTAKLPVCNTSRSDRMDLPISVKGEALSRGTLGSSMENGGKWNPSYDNIDCPGSFPDQAQKFHPQFGVDNSMMYPSSLTDGELMDEGESDSCERDSFNGKIEEDTATVSGSRNAGKHLRYGSPVFSVQGQSNYEDIDDARFSNDALQPHPFEQQVFNDADGVSKWQLKGKRNMRNLSRRHMDMSNGCINSNFCKADESLMDMNSGPWLSQEALGGYREEPEDCSPSRLFASELDPLDRMQCRAEKFESILVNVDLKVQASYQGEHVPLVSLMSRLNGKAIIGHPVQIEIMEDGSSDLLHTDFSFHIDTGENIESTELPPVWRTARRTVIHRIPRLHPSGAQDNEENLIPCSSLGSRHLLKRKSGVNVKHKKRSRKKWKHARHFLVDKKSRKLLKRVCVSNQKTKMLSSFVYERKTNANNDNSEGSVPVVACIAVKDVFNRLKESFNGLSAGSTLGNKDAD